MNTSNTFLDSLAERMIKLFPLFYPLFKQSLGNYDEYEVLFLQTIRASKGCLFRPDFYKPLGLGTKKASAMVKSLEAKGLVRTVAWKGKGAIDEVTPNGNKEFDDIKDRMKSLMKRIFLFASEEEIKTLIGLLERIDKKIKEHAEVVSSLP